MAAAWKVAVLSRQTARVSSPKSVSLLHRRGLSAYAGEHHGTPRVNCWEDPMHPSKWKRDQFVIVYSAGIGLLSYGGYKYYIEDKNKDKTEEMQKVGERPR